jgi:hypothetical protein
VGAFIGRPRSGSRACERGQFAATARAASGAPLLPAARRLTPFTDRIALALELADLRAAEVTLALEVIDVGRDVTPYEPIARAGHASGRSMAYGLGESGDHASRVKAASGRSVAVIRSSPCPGWQSFAAGKPRIKIAFEACRRSGAFNHDQIISPDAEKLAAPVRSNRPSIW